jgi:hypothetical protein
MSSPSPILHVPIARPAGRADAPVVPKARRDELFYPRGAAAEDERRRFRWHAAAALFNVVLMILLAALIAMMVRISW